MCLHGSENAPDAVSSSHPHPTSLRAIGLGRGPPGSDAQPREVLGLAYPHLMAWVLPLFLQLCLLTVLSLGTVLLTGFSSLTLTLPCRPPPWTEASPSLVSQLLLPGPEGPQDGLSVVQGLSIHSEW